MSLMDIGDGYFVDSDTGEITQSAPDTTDYQTPGYDNITTDTSSGGFNLKNIGDLLKGTSSLGMAGQLAGLGGIGALLNKMLGGSANGGYAGYQGGIPKYTASRTMNPIPQTVPVAARPAIPATDTSQAIAAQDATTAPRRPGSGGITYFTPMQYTPVGAAPATTTPVETVQAAGGGMMHGGIASLGGYSDGGQLLRGPGDGVSDDIPATIGNKQPARLADGEFVVPARIVSELGNGSTDAGARKLYAMMDRIKASRSKAKNIAANTKADKHLPA